MEIDVVCTTCGRPQLLKKTLESLNYFYPLKYFSSVVIHEDMPGTDNSELKTLFGNARFLEDGRKKGHMMSIDRLYREVKTDFFLHIEDDWEFLRGGFIEESSSVMLPHKDCMTMWLRAHGDTCEHPFLSNGRFLQMSTNHDHWAGFTLNPGLRRKSHYDFSFSEVAYPNRGPMAEVAIGQLMKSKGLVAAITKDARGYVRHIGEDCRTVDSQES